MKYFLQKLTKRMIVVVVLTVIASGSVYTCLPVGMAYAAFVEPIAGPAASDQDFTENIMGANNADNDFDSSTVAADVDGSLIERIEYIISILGWTKSSTILYYNTGNVGIGTSTPSALLEVSGTGQQAIKVTDTTSGITAGIWAGTTEGLFGTYTSHDLRLITDGTSKLTILSGGNVGIATTSPAYIFDVYGNSRIDGTLKIGAYTLPATDGDANDVLTTDGGGTITFAEAVRTPTVNVVQSSHGLSVGDAIKATGDDTYAKAQANTSANAEVVGIVTVVTDANNFTYATSGEVAIPAAVPNVTAGTTLFLSTTTPGALVAYDAIGDAEVSKPLTVVTNDNNSMVMVNFRGVEVDLSSTSINTGSDGQFPYYATSGEVLTATSSLYLTPAGNIGIGTVSPSVLLELAGAGQQGLKVTDTSNSITTGIWSGTTEGLVGTYTNHDLRLITNGTSKMTIEADGNVGIGTTSPFYKFSMNSGTNGFGIDSAGIIQQGTWNGTAIDFSDYTNATASTNITFTDDAVSVTDPFSVTNLTATYASSTNLTVSGDAWLDGNVGISSTTPAQKLSVTGKVYATEGFQLPDGSLIDAIGDLGKWSGSTDIYYSGGNVGIGTTSLSTYALNVHGSLYADDIYTSGSTFYMGGNPLLTRSTDTLDFGVETGENIDFTVNDTSALYVNSGGNIGIGTTSPSAALEVDGGIAFKKVTTDPCGAGYPEGTQFYNDEDNYMCYCDGTNDVQLHDPTAGCFWTCGVSTVDDADSNTYNTVLIGTQCWMAENLNVGSKLAAGTTEPANNSTIEKWCYDNSDANCTTYGGFYNWDEMMQYTETPGVQGICPTGWHLPTDAELFTLEDGLDSGTCSNVRTTWGCDPAGSKLAGNATLWTDGVLDAHADFGTSGFDALPSGYRNTNGAFGSSGTSTHFWSSSVSGASAWRRGLYSSYSTVRRNPDDQALGFSVRCLKD